MNAPRTWPAGWYELVARHGLAALLVLGSTLLGCDSGERSALADDNQAASGTSSGPSAGGSTSAAGTGSSSGGNGPSTGAGSLAEKYADHFPIGAAVGSWHLDTLGDVLEQDFNHLTCENAMKIQDIHPAEATFAWDEADRIADFARQKGMKLTGHTLLWHRQAPAWMFEGVTAGDAASLETLKMRLKAHIAAMVERYADVVDNWDVVNEALSDTAGKIYRDGPEGSTWYELFGSQDYIYFAFQYAKDALEESSPGSSAGKLYYNDYTATLKADKILTLLSWLKDEKGMQIDGVGFQSHEQLSWPSAADLQKAIDKVSGAGYKVKISELDITVYNDYPAGSFVAAPAVELTPELEAKQAKRLADLFALYRANKQHVTSVTFWGVSDDQTWLDNEPVPGRNDYPLLYGDAHTPKAARAAIMDF